MPSRPTESCDARARDLPELRTVARKLTVAPGAGAAERLAAPTFRSARRGFPTAATGARASAPHTIASTAFLAFALTICGLLLSVGSILRGTLRVAAVAGVSDGSHTCRVLSRWSLTRPVAVRRRRK